jgi:ABC-type phosphate transport system substrate-binding protein
MNRPLSFILMVCILALPLTACAVAQKPATGMVVYTRSDACGASDTWANYLGGHKQEDLLGTGVNGDPGIAEAVRQDVLGIGYNNIGYAYDISTGKQVDGLMVIPIDINGNGKIDAGENFYGTKAEIVRAIAEGKYPSPPARDLHLVTKDKYSGITREFVRWILTEGQQYVDPMGYIALPTVKIAAGLQKLGDTEPALKMEGTITISGAFALYPLMVKWGEEFQKLHPPVKFNISAGGAGKGMTDALGKMVDLGMLSREINPAEIEKGACWISVTRDAVVPVANAKNPYKQELLGKGLSKQAFADIWITGKIIDWQAASQ